MREGGDVGKGNGEKMAQSTDGGAAATSEWPARMMRQGWAGVAFWMAFGLLLEGLLGYKHPAYLDDPQRRELFRLAHAHGTLLSLMLIVAALCGRSGLARVTRSAGFALRIGTLLLPLGFMLSGVWHYEGDPGPAIWLVPLAALLVIYGAVTLAVSVGDGAVDD